MYIHIYIYIYIYIHIYICIHMTSGRTAVAETRREGVCDVGVGLCLTSSVLKSSCISQFQQKIVNLFFISVIVNHKLTESWGG